MCRDFVATSVDCLASQCNHYRKLFASGVALIFSSFNVHGESQSIEGPIERLGSVRLTEREAAQMELWNQGISAKPALEQAQNSPNPEIALRASQLLRRLMLGISPSSPNNIDRLADQYPSASLAEKREILVQLRKIEAWQCALYLFHRETPTPQRRELAPIMNGVAILATRSCLEQNNRAAALSLLEEYADDDSCNLARMWLLETPSLERAPRQPNRHATTRNNTELSSLERIALARIHGQRDVVIELTEKEHLPQLGATMRLLSGEARDWLQLNPTRAQNQHVLSHYTRAALSEWIGDKKSHASVQMLEKIAHGDDDQESRLLAAQALMGLGRSEDSVSVMRVIGSEALFEHYCDIERNTEALKLLKIQADCSNLATWIESQLSLILEHPEKYEVALPTLMQGLGFAERKGLYSEIESGFVPKMLEMADKHPEFFEEILISCFTPHGKMRQAAYAGMLVAIAHAERDPLRWNAMLLHAFQQQTGYSELWQWLQQLFPHSSPAELYRSVLVLFRLVQDRRHEREGMVVVIHRAISDMNTEQLAKHETIIDLLQSQTEDLGLRFQQFDYASNPLVLMIQHRWNEAILMWQAQIKIKPRLEFKINLAACLRAAGRDQEALEIEKKVQPLILADVSLMAQMAQIYADTGDFTRAQEWNDRVLNCGSTDDPNWWHALAEEIDWAMERQQWQVGAALNEALILESLNGRFYEANLSQLLRLRIAARSAACLTRIQQQASAMNTRAEQAATEADLQMLRDAHASLAMDASLADQFFPSLRAVGLVQLHDSLFQDSWQQFLRACQRFPQDDNLHNSAGWLAARAVRQLNQAQQLQQHALDLNPQQGAYLDTMAEISFAQSQRQTAINWSTMALHASPQAEPLRRQYYRFMREAFPK